MRSRCGHEISELHLLQDGCRWPAVEWHWPTFGFVNIAMFHTRELSCSTLGNFSFHTRESFITGKASKQCSESCTTIPCRFVTLSYCFKDDYVVFTCDYWRWCKLSVNLTLAAIEPCKPIGIGNGHSTSDAVNWWRIHWTQTVVKC